MSLTFTILGCGSSDGRAARRARLGRMRPEQPEEPPAALRLLVDADKREGSTRAC